MDSGADDERRPIPPGPRWGTLPWFPPMGYLETGPPSATGGTDGSLRSLRAASHLGGRAKQRDLFVALAPSSRPPDGFKMRLKRSDLFSLIYADDIRWGWLGLDCRRRCFSCERAWFRRRRRASRKTPAQYRTLGETSVPAQDEPSQDPLP